MFDRNEYKRKIKVWMLENPSASVLECEDYCHHLIPSRELTAHQWLVEETLSWFKAIQDKRWGYCPEDLRGDKK
ncbi:MAG: hypothetical protein OXT67_06575 [Zetaproteobacteria bacterium]|nr:hypothetical protein [Zetaproteobacteria bacterium]